MVKRNPHGLCLFPSYQLCDPHGYPWSFLEPRTSARLADHHVYWMRNIDCGVRGCHDSFYVLQEWKSKQTFRIFGLTQLQGVQGLIKDYHYFMLHNFLFIFVFQSDRALIHKNLCACLLIAEIIFLAGIDKTENPISCGIIAGLLHYFFLAAFAWMFIEGLFMWMCLLRISFYNSDGQMILTHTAKQTIDQNLSKYRGSHGDCRRQNYATESNQLIRAKVALRYVTSATSNFTIFRKSLRGL